MDKPMNYRGRGWTRTLWIRTESGILYDYSPSTRHRSVAAGIVQRIDRGFRGANRPRWARRYAGERPSDFRDRMASIRKRAAYRAGLEVIECPSNRFAIISDCRKRCFAAFSA